MYGRNALKGWHPSREIPFPAALPGPIGQEKLKRTGIPDFFVSKEVYRCPPPGGAGNRPRLQPIFEEWAANGPRLPFEGQTAYPIAASTFEECKRAPLASKKTSGRTTSTVHFQERRSHSTHL